MSGTQVRAAAAGRREYRHPTSDRLTTDQALAVVSRLAYSREDIAGCELDPNTQEIVVEVAASVALGELAQMLNGLICDAAEVRVIKRRVLRREERSRAGASAYGVLDNMFDGSGAGALEGAGVELLERVDRRLTEFATAVGAGARRYPSMISMATMARCRYLATFPQNAYLVAEFPHDAHALHRLQECDDPATFARISGYMLAPAVCFHCYEELASQLLTRPVVLTASGSCFRHEADWRVGAHRLREFSMREIVFFGPPPFVESMRSQLMDRVWQWFQHLGFRGRIETATDPFFFAQDAIKAQYQLMAHVKYELVVTLRNGEEIAIGSFNNVRDSLCRPFAVTGAGGSPLHSGCVAMGLHRWVYALLTEYGSQLGAWPATARRALG